MSLIFKTKYKLSLYTMIGLTDRIKVTVIRTAAGVRTGPIGGGCGDSAPAYYVSGHLSLQLPEGCGNFETFYDPSLPHKVINIMNFCGAPSSEYFAFSREDLANQLDLQCELQSGDDVIFLWKPLFSLSPALWFTGSTVPRSTPKSTAQPPAAESPATSVQPEANVSNPASSPLFRFVRLR